MGLPDVRLLANSFLSNVLPDILGPGDLGRGGRLRVPKPALEPPRTGDLPRIRPVSRRRMGTWKVAAVGHGGVAVIAWLSDSTGVGQAHGYAKAFSTICQWPDFISTLYLPYIST